MQFFCFLAAFLLVRHLQGRLKNTDLYIKWSSLLNIALWSTIGLYIVIESFESSLPSGVKIILGASLLAGLVYYIREEPDFIPFRSFANAHIPLIIISSVYGIADLFLKDNYYYEAWHMYLELAVIAGYIWIFARTASSRKQQQQLDIAAVQNAKLEKMVAERTGELTRQKDELQITLKELKATQQQLIQQEKLASLGELTAGIAHEIQNPLNFVNNFSDVSIELIEEMEQELESGNREEAIAIANDIKQNLEKIRHHGNRADGIVKGMLQHSRATSNIKEPTSINKLADEYLRLAYHGLRAKNKNFNAEMVTHFDENIPLIKIIPQDVGRVLLNIYTNAFYAMQQKQKAIGTAYKPMLEVSTLVNAGNSVEIKVKDNGTGIPDSIKEKILQPFFTTKPSGEGTGLGLSLSHDIVVKGHGGTIHINSTEGEYTEFVVTLPQ